MTEYIVVLNYFYYSVLEKKQEKLQDHPIVNHTVCEYFTLELHFLFACYVIRSRTKSFLIEHSKRNIEIKRYILIFFFLKLLSYIYYFVIKNFISEIFQRQRILSIKYIAEKKSALLC